MRDDKVTETVLPSLFWRIDEAEQVRALGDSSVAIYREDVLRSLKWLLNSCARPSRSNVRQSEALASSVLNFGLPPTVGRIGSTIDPADFAKEVKRVILDFEPRILTDSLSITHSLGEEEEIILTISGNIWCEPLPESFSFQTKVDAETGNWIFEKP